MNLMRKKQKGQVLTEYTLLLVLFGVITLTLMTLLSVFTQYGFRIISLVAEYPYDY